MGEYIDILDIEAAINFWRAKEGRCSKEAPDVYDAAHEVAAKCASGRSTVALSKDLSALAELYGKLVYAGRSEARVDEFSAQAMAAWLQWYETMPDAPCIAVCSTSQGDDVCRGCGRTFEEVQYWTAMSPAAKRVVWRWITQEGTALRFTRYKERSSRQRV